MKQKKLTQQEIWNNGTQMIHYPCDVGGSNASVEHEVEYLGKIYLVVTDWDDNVLNPDAIATRAALKK
jgi:hypothetical protein